MVSIKLYLCALLMQINIQMYKTHAWMEEQFESTKHIIISVKDQTSQEAHPNPKIPRKRIVSQTDNWIDVMTTHSTQESQILLLLQVQSSFPSDAANVLLSHLKTKQSGYRSQDTAKDFYVPERFIQIQELVSLLIDSNLSCFYCRKWTTLFYENVRDPCQWSLERLSNAEGHNRDNVVIACLECNMRRRTMYYERYIATKQLKVNKLSGYESDQII
jgi:hypothetical protein